MIEPTGLRLYPFQTSLETLRGHHWRYFADIYQGCQFSCEYCLYRGPGDYGAHVGPAPAAPADLLQSIAAKGPHGIIDIGAMTDPYQPIEQQQKRTRAALERLLELSQPCFVLTRGTLVTRDADILIRLADRGLTEVCFSLISLDTDTTRTLEHRTPMPSDRLAAARSLADQGVPVSFHLAPLIPGLYRPGELSELVTAMATAGARHIFSAILGARSGFWDTFTAALEQLGHRFHDWSLFRAAYPADLSLTGAHGAATCDGDFLFPAMDELRDACTAHGIPFVCETAPAFTSSPLEGHIYRWKLPTVYDMAEWVRRQTTPVELETFHNSYYSSFGPGKELSALVSELWTGGTLFHNTTVRREPGPGIPRYSASERIEAGPTRTLTVRRAEVRP